MKAVLLALLFLGSVLFFRADGTKVASIFKWKLLTRARRDALMQLDPSVESYIDPLDMTDALSTRDVLRQQSQGNNRRIRMKRGVGCKLSLCRTQELIDKLNQWTDPSKDSSAPPKQLSVSGYGRRRRSFAIPLVQG